MAYGVQTPNPELRFLEFPIRLRPCWYCNQQLQEQCISNFELMTNDLRLRTQDL